MGDDIRSILWEIRVQDLIQAAAEGEEEGIFNHFDEADLVGMTHRQMSVKVDLLTLAHASNWLNTTPIKALLEVDFLAILGAEWEEGRLQ